MRDPTRNTLKRAGRCRKSYVAEVLPNPRRSSSSLDRISAMHFLNPSASSCAFRFCSSTSRETPCRILPSLDSISAMRFLNTSASCCALHFCSSSSRRSSATDLSPRIVRTAPRSGSNAPVQRYIFAPRRTTSWTNPEGSESCDCSISSPVWVTSPH